MKKIKLTNCNKYTLVDAIDYDRVDRFKWHLNDKGYACQTAYSPKGERIKLHRLVMDFPKGKTVDHKNGNKLDNRKKNLRVCSQAQNCFNSRKKGGTNPYKGVTWKKANKKWSAAIGFKRKQYYLGLFDSAKEARQAYWLAAQQFHGEFARK